MGSFSVKKKIHDLITELPETSKNVDPAYDFLRTRTEEGSFPRNFLTYLMDIESILEEIERNSMVSRWKGFQNIANKSILNKIGNNPIRSQGFDFIATI